ncbi:hypothetical protein BJY52DRAFT_1238370 [Lactarius psammicola]|nr:hypothetical protein BJY52DRAFT_1238370 [Lactarius psammicola]
MDYPGMSELEIGFVSESDSWPANDKNPRPDTRHISVAMPSVQLRSSADNTRHGNFRCNACDACFDQWHKLYWHSTDKHGAKRICPFCPFRWRLDSRIKAHLMSVHQDVLSAEALQVIRTRYGRNLAKFLDTDYHLRHYAIPQAGASSTPLFPAPAINPRPYTRTPNTTASTARTQHIAAFLHAKALRESNEPRAAS